ncbi:serine hydrolase domain-containing protein [Sphingomonas lenta]|uniref:Beta-lactamase-related domain-containing protein n=1 Tax=Sphingomonas lenta TaxID=1141887 RepID=A0A2A2SGM3_9SPHN|nr:serine hydrolase domain-containing protein [Sphingomonas lenta]PAX08444.1 hypothetical protein CKY28_03365 [Sphingomonas lenta]
MSPFRHLMITLSAAALAAASPAPTPGESFAAEVVALAGSTTFDAATWLAAHGLAAQDADAAAVLGALRRAGPIELVSLNEQGTLLETTMRRKADGRSFRVVGVAAKDGPGKLRALFAVPVPTPYTMPAFAGPLSEADLKKAVDARVSFAAERDEFSGTVLVMHGDRVVYARSVGQADREAGAANGPDTKFNIGSMGKMFTAVAVMQQVEAGKLSLDTTVGQVLPDYPNEAARAVTVRQLLNHSAGLGNLWERKGWNRTGRYPTAASVLPVFAAEPLMFAPGSRAGYSNEGFVLLSAMVERLAGVPFPAYVERHILAPAGMHDTSQADQDQPLAGRAMGYRYAEADLLGLGDRERMPEPISLGSNGAGGQFATAADMLRFLQALRGGELISARSLATLVAPGGGQRNYGLGFERDADGALIGHDGGGPHSGVNADAKIAPVTGWSYAVMGNYDAPFAQVLGKDIGELLTAMD